MKMINLKQLFKLNNNSKPLFGDISVLSNYSFMNDYINNYQGIDRDFAVLKKSFYCPLWNLEDEDTEEQVLDSFRKDCELQIFKHKDELKHLFEINLLEYNPIENYNGKETTRDAHGGNDTTTIDNDKTTTYTENETQTHTGTDTQEHTGTDTVNMTGTDTQEHTGTDTVNMTGTDTQEHTGTDTVNITGTDKTTNKGTDVLSHKGTDETTHNETFETKHSGEDTQETQKSAYNVSSYSPNEKNINTYNSKNNDVRNYTDSTTKGITDTQTKDLVNEETKNLKDETVKNLTDKETKNLTDTYEKNSQNTEDGTINTIQNYNSYTEHTSERSGNIGVTSTQDMMNQEKDFWLNYNFYNILFDIIVNELCVYYDEGLEII